ncbi:Myo-inositol monophosphatase A3 [Intoshia linei]|uniref:3'(2'),5'-bisphosphate nucleotidase 1 n=1 Tax=Intoshia linei TaxID=1819745 RepID=A0A177B3A2_9BILA|nr:Myo-inositol monophosphatase A3 [Intoshia linei]
MSLPLLTRLVANCYNISLKAGEIIKQVRKNGNLEIVEKGYNDFQTIADVKSQCMIIKSLQKNYPGVCIVGEEDTENIDSAFFKEMELVESLSDEVVSKCKTLPEEYKNIKENEIVIWVDPLDGTNEYTKGIVEHVTILIGIARFGKPIAGIICQPYFKSDALEKLGRVVWGIVGIGSFGLFKNQTTHEGLIITTTRSHPNKPTQEAIEAINPTTVLKLGGAGNKILNVIEGNADAYVYASGGTKKWDTCSPEAVIIANGGVLTDICGNCYSYEANVEHPNNTGILATTSTAIHDQIKKCIPENVINEMKTK